MIGLRWRWTLATACFPVGECVGPTEGAAEGRGLRIESPEDTGGEFAEPSDLWSATSPTTPGGATVPLKSPSLGLWNEH
jgi:hypothetical protein